jgi:hypothetical protein
MGRFRVRLALLSSAAVFLLAGSVQASITRVSGPTNLVDEPRVFVKFDAAFDSVNRIYLAVWGTQFAGPTNGLFLNEAGAPIGPVFAISDHSDGALQAGWARVVYSPQEQKFLVSYVKIFPGSVHAKAARFVTYSGGAPSLSNEIRIATWGGHPGTEAGIAYSAPARKFFVTWWVYYGAKPVTFVTAIDPSGAIQSPAIPGVSGFGTPISNPNDGQSDPEIACDPATRHCLVIGWSWGTFYGGNSPPPAVWGRYIDDATGAPLGPDSFYLPAFGYVDSPTVSFGAGKYLVAYTGNGQVIGHTASGSAVDASTVSPYYGLRVSSGATAAQDGGGYRYPALSFNSATNTTLLAVAGYQGYPTAQEIDANGQPIAGSLDFIPDPGPNYDNRTQFTVSVADPVAAGFLYLDNHIFLTMRASRYSSSGLVTSPPPPPCPSTLSVAPSIAVMSPSRTLSIGITVPATCGWTAVSNVGWMQITSAGSGTGPAGVTFSVLRNAGGADRTGTLSIAGQSVSVRQAGFNNAATSDVDFDGYSDLIWQKPDGTLAMWSVQRNSLVSAQLLPSVADPSWRVVGSGDLNGDGHADLVWQKTEGTLAAWFWTPTGYLSGTSFLTPTDVGLHWKVRGVADLNGDGRADLVFQHDTEGWLAVWYMSGANAIATVFLSIAQQPDPNWQIAGAGDINGDGRADIVWQNQATGNLAAWLMNGSQVIGTNLLSIPMVADLNWKVMGVGDMDGDGRADLLWQNLATGDVAEWTLMGYTVQSTKFIYYADGVTPVTLDTLVWRMVGPG